MNKQQQARKLWSQALKQNNNDEKKAFRKLAMTHHPDRGGDGELFALIATLKDGGGFSSSSSSSRPWNTNWDEIFRRARNAQKSKPKKMFRTFIFDASEWDFDRRQRKKDKRDPIGSWFNSSFLDFVLKEIHKQHPLDIEDSFYIMTPEKGLTMLGQKVTFKERQKVSDSSYASKVRRKLLKHSNGTSKRFSVIGTIYLFGGEESKEILKDALAGTGGGGGGFKWVPKNQRNKFKELMEKKSKGGWTYEKF